jgi:hypothetical protein
MHKNTTKCNKTQSKWCINKHGASKIIDTFETYQGHEVFEEKIKKPMELYLHANSNVISMNSLNTIIANTMEKSKLGEASFMKMIFLVSQL